MSLQTQPKSTHLMGFFINTTFGATLANVNPIQDDIISKAGAGDRFQIPDDYHSIFAAAALGTTLTRALLTTPSLEVRREVLEIWPRRTASISFSLANIEVFKPYREIVLKSAENIILQTADTSGAGVAKYGLLWLKQPGDLDPMPDGDIRIVRATASQTLVANVWTSCTIALDKDLEPGTYALVGFLPISATAIAARAIIPRQNYRPGMPGLAGTEGAASDFDNFGMEDLMYYRMGDFVHTNIPQFQFLSSAADTTEVIYLMLIRVGEAPVTAG